MLKNIELKTNKRGLKSYKHTFTGTNLTLNLPFSCISSFPVGTRMIDYVGAETVWTRAECIEFGQLLLERRHLHTCGGSYGFYDDKDNLYRFVEIESTSDDESSSMGEASPAASPNEIRKSVMNGSIHFFQFLARFLHSFLPA